MPAHLMQDDVCAQAHAAPEGSLHGGDAQNGTGKVASAPQRETAFFNNFAQLADSLGVYTAHDYAKIMSHLMRRWRIRDLQVCYALQWVACCAAVLWCLAVKRVLCKGLHLALLLAQESVSREGSWCSQLGVASVVPMLGTCMALPTQCQACAHHSFCKAHAHTARCR